MRFLRDTEDFTDIEQEDLSKAIADIHDLIKFVSAAAEDNAEQFMRTHGNIHQTKVAQNEDVIQALVDELPYVKPAKTDDPMQTMANVNKPNQRPSKLRRLIARFNPKMVKFDKVRQIFGESDAMMKNVLQAHRAEMSEADFAYLMRKIDEPQFSPAQTITNESVVNAHANSEREM